MRLSFALICFCMIFALVIAIGGIAGEDETGTIGVGTAVHTSGYESRAGAILVLR